MWIRSLRPSVLTPKSLVTRHVIQFVVAGLFALGVVMLAGLVASRRLGTSEAIRDATERTTVLSRTVVEERMTPELLNGDAEAQQALAYHMAEIIETESFLHIRIWTEDGLIVYSDREGMTGTVGQLGSEATEAFEKGTIIAEVSELEEAENILEREQGQLLEVYQPITATDGTPLLLETYDSYANVEENAQLIWWNFLPAVLIPLVLLQLAQLPFAIRLARRVEHTQNERAELLERVISSNDDERKGIAHDLHDGAVQDLAGVGYALSVVSERAKNAGDERSVELLDGVQVDVRRSIQSLRSLFVEIYPPNLQRSGLHVALSDLLAAVSGRGIDVRLDYPEGLELSPETNRILYRVAQEATRNVTRHAKATQLDIEVVEGPDSLTLRVADNGKGFDSNDSINGKSGHFGLRIMKDLAIEAGGHLDIYSKPGIGTDLRLQLPR